MRHDDRFDGMADDDRPRQPAPLHDYEHHEPPTLGDNLDCGMKRFIKVLKADEKYRIEVAESVGVEPDKIVELADKIRDAAREFLEFAAQDDFIAGPDE